LGLTSARQVSKSGICSLSAIGAGRPDPLPARSYPSLLARKRVDAPLVGDLVVDRVEADLAAIALPVCKMQLL
jgi:hypothetical protein